MVQKLVRPRPMARGRRRRRRDAISFEIGTIDVLMLVFGARVDRVR